MPSRKQYEEHSERDFQVLPLALYHSHQMIIPPHWHRDLELILPENPGVIEIEGESYPYQAGDIVCVNKGLLHRTTQPLKSADILVADLRIFLSPLIQQDEASFINQLEQERLALSYRIGEPDHGYPDILHALQECTLCMRSKKINWELILQREFLQFLELCYSNGHMHQIETRPYNPQAEAIKESIAFIKRNFAQPLTLCSLAEQAALSPSHYIRLFRHYTGETPIAFLSDVRLEEAAACLKQGMTVSEAALQVGIPNISYFIRIFRKKYGQTPKQYQLANLLQKPPTNAP